MTQKEKENRSKMIDPPILPHKDRFLPLLLVSISREKQNYRLQWFRRRRYYLLLHRFSFS